MAIPLTQRVTSNGSVKSEPRTETRPGQVRSNDPETYSVCMLCSNDGETVEASVRSVLELSKYRKTEVVVVDNLSSDNSKEFLRKVRDAGLITLIERRCSRGEGRQLAFNASKGKYLLSHMDCDDIFDAAGIDSLIARYHAGFEGMAIMTKRLDSPEASNITIAPRSVLDLVGGWRPLNWGEDWDLWARLSNAGLYSFLPYPQKSPPHVTVKVRVNRFTGPTRGFSVKVAKYADSIRIGRRVFDPGERVSVLQKLALVVAKLRVAVAGSTLAKVPDPYFSEEETSERKVLPKYSVCMTCYNETSTIRDSLTSLLNQLNKDCEVVVVDNFSRDGTYEVLQEFEQSRGIRVIQKKCSRGLGRQIAFENSIGEYIIANLDLDDTFRHVLSEVLDLYHQKVEGDLLAVFNTDPPPDVSDAWVQNITIGPRSLVATLGGWRDVNIFEDWDLWSRASRAGKYKWTTYRFAENETSHPESKAASKRLAKRHERYLIRLRLGMNIFGPGEKKGLSQRLAYIWARAALPFTGVLAGQDPSFKSLDIRYFVDFAPKEPS
jgi:glycosyltransferase involved in cell wall biosynthesis